MTISIARLQRELEMALVRGWKNFTQSPEYNTLSGFLKFLSKAGFFESEFYRIVANPAYHFAAQCIGEQFLETARRHGVYFAEIFPGDFAASRQVKDGAVYSRRFTLTAYRGRRRLCCFSLNFRHRHDRLEFPSPPQLRLVT